MSKIAQIRHCHICHLPLPMPFLASLDMAIFDVQTTSISKPEKIRASDWLQLPQYFFLIILARSFCYVKVVEGLRIGTLVLRNISDWSRVYLSSLSPLRFSKLTLLVFLVPFLRELWAIKTLGFYFGTPCKCFARNYKKNILIEREAFNVQRKCQTFDTPSFLQASIIAQNAQEVLWGRYLNA